MIQRIIQKESLNYSFASIQQLSGQISNYTRISPAARAHINQFNLNINSIQGTGRRGLITKEDVQNFQMNDSPNYQIIQFNRIQKLNHHQITLSQHIPTLQLHDEYDITELVQAKNSINPSLTSIIIKFLSIALKSYPIINSIYTNDSPSTYKQYQQHNIAVMIHTPQGYLMPIIKNIQNLSIIQIQSELQRLKQQCLQGNFIQNDIQHPTIVIHNYGKYGPLHISSAVQYPNLCTLNIGRIQQIPNHQGQLIHEINVSWGADHRILDGATMTRMSNKLKQLLEQPALAIIDLK